MHARSVPFCCTVAIRRSWTLLLLSILEAHDVKLTGGDIIWAHIHFYTWVQRTRPSLHSWTTSIGRTRLDGHHLAFRARWRISMQSLLTTIALVLHTQPNLGTGRSSRLHAFTITVCNLHFDIFHEFLHHRGGEFRASKESYRALLVFSDWRYIPQSIYGSENSREA